MSRDRLEYLADERRYELDTLRCARPPRTAEQADGFVAATTDAAAMEYLTQLAAVYHWADTGNHLLVAEACVRALNRLPVRFLRGGAELLGREYLREMAKRRCLTFTPDPAVFADLRDRLERQRTLNYAEGMQLFTEIGRLKDLVDRLETT